MNKARRREYDRARYKRLGNKIRAQRKLRYYLNKEQEFALNRKRRAREYNIKEHYTKQMAKITYKTFNNLCFNCGNNQNLQIDHHKPLSKGYALTLKNAVILCKSCNCSKSNKMPKQFYSKKQLSKLNKILKNLK